MVTNGQLISFLLGEFNIYMGSTIFHGRTPLIQTNQNISPVYSGRKVRK